MTEQKASTQVGRQIDAATGLAAERTLLAWVRTGLSLMGFGFVVARFGLFLRELTAAEHLSPKLNPGFSHWFGGGLMALGVLVLVLSGVQHIQFIRRLNSGVPYQVKCVSLVVLLTFFLAGFGLAMTAYLIYSTS